MKKFLLTLIIGCGFFTASYASDTTDLVTVYQEALQSDPTILEARETAAANSEQLPQAGAALLPNAALTAQTESVRNTLARDSNANQHFYTLTLGQPVLNLQSWMQVRAAGNAVKAADATYNAALQDLIIRTTTAYLNVLQAEDTLRFTESEKAATFNQLKQIKDKYSVGLSTLTDVYQAQASYDNLVAAEISAKNQIVNNMEALREITGQTYTKLTPLINNVPLVSPQPNDVTEWIDTGEKYNWSLVAARYSTQSAKENIRVNFAGHFPVVNAVGIYQKGNNLGASQFTVPNEESQKSVGFQLSLPLFQGGLVTSQTRQAQDQYLAASDQMEVVHRQVIFQSQESFNNVMTGISKIKADRVAVTSGQSALDSTDAGYKAGTKTILDVLAAQQNLFQAEATLSSDQYAYINSTLALKQAAGTLSPGDILAINGWLKHERC